MTTSRTLVFKAAASTFTAAFSIWQTSAFAWSNSAFFITPGRTVDMQGRNRGQMMVAIRWPPNAGRVIFKLVSSILNFTESTSMVEDSRRNWTYLFMSMSRWVQSAVRPVWSLAATRGPKSRPILEAPISSTSGFFSITTSQITSQ